MIEVVCGHLAWAAIALGGAVGLFCGSFVGWGIDRAELAAYRRITRGEREPSP